MRALPSICLLLALTAAAFGQAATAVGSVRGDTGSPLDAKVEHFDVKDGILRDGLSELSLRNVKNLHLGFEEIIRDRIQDDPWSLGGSFSLHLEAATVREILDALCKADSRYTWTQDAQSLNIYPKGTDNDTSYLLNLRIERLLVNVIPDPDQALTQLSEHFPDQQVGYAGAGLGGDAYAEPWTATFERVTVRQFINRLAEHMGPQTSWVWQGGKNERLFTFFRGGFHTTRKAEHE